MGQLQVYYNKVNFGGYDSKLTEKFVTFLAQPLNLAAMSICAPAFNHKLKKLCTFRGVSEILKKPHRRTEELKIG